MPSIVPGCPNPVLGNYIGIRLRRPNSNAVRAPKMDAFIGNAHSVSGLRLTIFFEEANDGCIETRVCGGAPGAATIIRPITRRTPIGQPP